MSSDSDRFKKLVLDKIYVIVDGINEKKKKFDVNGIKDDIEKLGKLLSMYKKAGGDEDFIPENLICVENEGMYGFLLE